MIEALDEIFERLADLEHVESRQLRLFTIAEVDADGLRVRYRYEGGESSAWHPWASVSSRSHHPPVVGETCLVVMQHGNPELSVALCGVRYEAGKDGRGADCKGDADVLQGAYRYDRDSGVLTLGTSSPTAETMPVAGVPPLRKELDAVWEAISQVRDALAGHTHLVSPVTGLVAPTGGGQVTGTLNVPAPLGISPVVKAAEDLEPTGGLVRVPRER